MEIELAKVDSIISKHGTDRRALTSLLLELQDEFHFLPQEALERIAEKMQVPAIQVYQVARFYKAFSLKPRGKHLISVCAGTACHVQAGRDARRKSRATVAHRARRNDGGRTIHPRNDELSGQLSPGSSDDCGWHLSQSSDCESGRADHPATQGWQGGNTP